MVFAFLPSSAFKALGVSGDLAWHANVLLSHVLLAMAIFLSPALRWAESVPSACLCQSALRIPCPGCGVTTSLQAISLGDFRQAAIANPAGIGLLVAMMIQIGLHANALCRPRASIAVNRYSGLVGQLTLSSLLTIWLVRLFSLVL